MTGNKKSITVASENRKIRKPLMEKKRRARINDSLETLKRILLESKTILKETSNKSSRQRTTKLEKADILEMTVGYLQDLRNKINYGTLATVRPREGQVKTKLDAAKKLDDSSYEVKNCVAILPDRLRDKTFVKSSNGCRESDKNGSENGKNIWRPW